MRNKFLVEMLGTMVLVLMGCGAAVMNGGAISVAAVLTIAFAFGLSVVAMAYTIGTISGCHINPAVTVGVWLSGRMPASEAGVYILAQVIGGVLGSAILCVVTGMMGLEGTGANSFGESHLAGALVAEAVFTFVFVLVVLGCTDSRNNNLGLAGLAIGLALVLVHIVCIPLTGTSVNPAPEHRTCNICRWYSSGAALGIYRGSFGGGSYRSYCLEGRARLTVFLV